MIHLKKSYWSYNEYGLEEHIVKGEEKKPFALILPDGGYSGVCSFVEGLPFAKKLNEMGYSAFILRYHVKDKARYPAPLEDVEKALKYIFDNSEKFNIKTEGWSIWGSSAGGHLTALFTAEKRYTVKPASVILVYPVITMTDLTHKESRENFLGKNPTAEMINKTSVEKLIDSEYPPVYIWYGTADSTVDIRNSKMFIEALDKNNIKYKAHEFPQIKHGTGLGTGTTCEPWFKEAVEFWGSNM